MAKKMRLSQLSFSKQVLSIFKNAKKKLVLIKNGDHSLSKKTFKNNYERTKNIVKDIH